MDAKQINKQINTAAVKQHRDSDSRYNMVGENPDHTYGAEVPASVSYGRHGDDDQREHPQ